MLTAPGDNHGLPSVMATIALRRARWRAEHLGIDVPEADLLLLVDSVGADAAVISLTYPAAGRGARRLARAARRGGRPDVGGPPWRHAGRPARRAPRTHGEAVLRGRRAPPTRRGPGRGCVESTTGPEDRPGRGRAWTDALRSCPGSNPPWRRRRVHRSPPTAPGAALWGGFVRSSRRTCSGRDPSALRSISSTPARMAARTT